MKTHKHEANKSVSPIYFRGFTYYQSLEFVSTEILRLLAIRNTDRVKPVFDRHIFDKSNDILASFLLSGLFLHPLIVRY